jgi:hypothetical protein
MGSYLRRSSILGYGGVGRWIVVADRTVHKWPEAKIHRFSEGGNGGCSYHTALTSPGQNGGYRHSKEYEEQRLSNPGSRIHHLSIQSILICAFLSLNLPKPMLRALPGYITGPSAFRELTCRKSVR